MTAVMIVCAALLSVALILVIRRVELGPSILDRVVGIDVLVSTLLAALALYAAWADRTDLLVTMVVLSLVGFVGSVSVARFVAAESEDEGRILPGPGAPRRRTRRRPPPGAGGGEGA